MKQIKIIFLLLGFLFLLLHSCRDENLIQKTEDSNLRTMQTSLSIRQKAIIISQQGLGLII